MEVSWKNVLPDDDCVENSSELVLSALTSGALGTSVWLASLPCLCSIVDISDFRRFVVPRFLRPVLEQASTEISGSR